MMRGRTGAAVLLNDELGDDLAVVLRHRWRR